ncbi:MAG: hypothetical protein Q8Q36_02855 [bacterium]|nr:hypothetical protein [bacterium]
MPRLEHEACAKLLMDDYGVPKEFKAHVVEEIERIWHNERLPHCLIVAGVRGYQEIRLTRSLEHFLDRHRTHPPKYKRTQRAE